MRAALALLLLLAAARAMHRGKGVHPAPLGTPGTRLGLDPNRCPPLFPGIRARKGKVWDDGRVPGMPRWSDAGVAGRGRGWAGLARGTASQGSALCEGDGGFLAKAAHPTPLPPPPLFHPPAMCPSVHRHVTPWLWRGDPAAGKRCCRCLPGQYQSLTPGLSKKSMAFFQGGCRSRTRG